MLRPGKLGVDGQHVSSSEPVHWRRGELIGAGAFGRVYMGLNNETGQLMAVKQVCNFTEAQCPILAQVPQRRPVSTGLQHLQDRVKVGVRAWSLHLTFTQATLFSAAGPVMAGTISSVPQRKVYRAGADQQGQACGGEGERACGGPGS